MCLTPLERLARPRLCGWVLAFLMGMPGQGVAWQLPARHALRRASAALAAPAGEGAYEVESNARGQEGHSRVRDDLAKERGRVRVVACRS